MLIWQESILFVILASVYANFASELAAAEAADDLQLAQRLDRIETMLAELVDNGADTSPSRAHIKQRPRPPRRVEGCRGR